MPLNHRHEILTGSFHPDLESALRDRVAAFRATHAPLAPLPILVPSNLLKVYLRRRLVELGRPHIGIEFFTLQDLVAEVHRRMTASRRSLPQFADELIVEQVIRERVSEDSYFGPVRATAGFRASVLAAFKDLKEAGIASAEFRALVRKTPTLDRAKFAQLADLFAAYDHCLAQHGAEDAAAALARAAVADYDPLPDCGTVFFYGFYDFNHLQRKLIARLAAGHALTVFFPYHPSEEATPDHDAGAFVYAEPTLRWFEALLGVEPDAVNGDPDSLPETLFQFRSRLFNEPRSKPTAPPEAAHLEILSLPGEPREAREILRQVLAFCEDKNASRLHHVAILPRQSEPYVTLLNETANSRAIAAHLASGRPLMDDVAARGYLKMLDVARTNFGRAAVMEFATLAPLESSQFLSPELVSGFVPAEWDQLSAVLGIVKGAETWRQRLKAQLSKLDWQRAHPDPDEDESRQAAECARAKLVMRALGAFVDTLDVQLMPLSVGLSQTPQPWARHVTASLRAFRALVKPSEAVERLAAAIEPLAALDPFETRADGVTLDVFGAYARRALESETVRETTFEDGGVFIGGLMGARGLSWPMVVLPGLGEKTFPRLVREDPILLDAEREAINRIQPDDTLPRSSTATHSRSAALPLRLDLKRRGHDEERLLFQLAVESARERLVLTFPRFDPASGRPRVPSMFLLHAAEALTGDPPDYKLLETATGVFRRVPLNNPDPPPPLLDDTDKNLSLFANLRAQKIGRFRPLLDAIAPRLAEGLRCEQTRWGTPAFTVYDGVFADVDAMRRVAAVLDPAAREFSATAFEQFARCPRCFFEAHLLDIEEWEEPEETVSLPPREIGNLVHRVLSESMKELRKDGLLPLRPQRDAENWQRIELVASKCFAEFERQGFTGIPLLWEVQQEWLLADLRTFLNKEYERQEEGIEPHVIEWPFGKSAGDAETRGGAVTVAVGDRATLRFRGRIDRVDRAPDGSRFVTDYKTGSPPSKWKPSFSQKRLASSPLNGGQLLQVPIYILAAAALGGRARGGQLYYATSRGGFVRLEWRDAILAAALRELPSMLGALHAAMAQGIFFQRRDCARCGGSAMPQAAAEALFDMKCSDKRVAKLLTATNQQTAESRGNALREDT